MSRQCRAYDRVGGPMLGARTAVHGRARVRGDNALGSRTTWRYASD